MNQYILTKSAEADLIDIWLYTNEKWDEKQADKYVKNLESYCKSLAETPSLGRNLKNIRKDLHVCKCDHHYIFYTKHKTSITRLAFYHERMNVIRRLKSRL